MMEKRLDPKRENGRMAFLEQHHKNVIRKERERTGMDERNTTTHECNSCIDEHSTHILPMEVLQLMQPRETRYQKQIKGSPLFFLLLPSFTHHVSFPLLLPPVYTWTSILFFLIEDLPLPLYPSTHTFSFHFDLSLWNVFHREKRLPFVSHVESVMETVFHRLSHLSFF